MRSVKKVVVVGAGASGLLAIKSCLEENLQVTCYEQTRYTGGLWQYREDVTEGQASVMKSTVMNTSKEISAISDFPPPSELPNYLHNKQALKYLQMYAEKFNLLKRIRFHHQVLHICKCEDYDQTGRWQIKVRDLQKNIDTEDIVDGVIVCVGQSNYPNMVKFPGMDKFCGQVIHSHSYRVPNGYEDKNVLVIGMGNSAIDVAVELGTISNKVYLSTHRGAWVVPRRGFFGWPFDTVFVRRIIFLLFALFPRIPQFLGELYANLQFNHNLYDLKPKHGILNQGGIVNDLLSFRVASGTVILKSDVEHFTENGVVFVGERSKEYPIDTIIMCTGYVLKFPFLESGNMNEKRFELYKLMIPPQLKHPSLAFIGLSIITGAAFPIFEMQSRYIVQTMVGKVQLPSKDGMIEDIEENARWNREMFFNGKNYEGVTPTSYLYAPYMDELAIQIGAKPDLQKLLFTDIKLFWQCVFGPFVSYQYRLTGPHAWSGARNALLTVNKRIKKAFKTRHVPPSTKSKDELNNRSEGLFIFGMIIFLSLFLFL